MKIESILSVMPVLFTSNLVPLIWGIRGTGKSSIVKQYTKDNELEFVDLRLGTQETGDLIGLPAHEKDSSGRFTSTTFVPPSWWPRDPNSRGVIFLDEINRARPEVLQAIFQLVLDREMHTHKLPVGWNIVAAANPPSDEYNVSMFDDEAFMDRFVHVKFEPTNQEWLSYAQKNQVHTGVTAYLSEHPGSLDGVKNTKVNALDSIDGFIKPSRRTWERLSTFIKNAEASNIKEEDIHSIVFGMVGMEEGLKFVNYLRTMDKPFTPEEILEKMGTKAFKEKVSKQFSEYEKNTALCNATCDSLMAYLAERTFAEPEFTKQDKVISTKEVKNLAAFLDIVPKDKLVEMASAKSHADVQSKNVFSIHVFRQALAMTKFYNEEIQPKMEVEVKKLEEEAKKNG